MTQPSPTVPDPRFASPQPSDPKTVLDGGSAPTTPLMPVPAETLREEWFAGGAPPVSPVPLQAAATVRDPAFVPASIDAADLSTSSPEALTGRKIGKYRLLRLLGRGGMGAVYLAEDEDLRRRVALKFILNGALAGQEEEERFFREARAGARLQHPGVVPVYEVGRVGTLPYIAMAYLEGTSLHDLLWQGANPSPAAGRSVGPRDLLQILRDTAQALHYIHEHGIVHRDLKPANLLVDPQGKPHILDLGLARDLSDEKRGRLTASKDVFGTPEFMAPEQASGGSRQADRRTDVFALGTILYHAWSGVSPFARDSIMGTMEAVVALDPESPSRARRRAGRPWAEADLGGIREVDVDTVCLKAMEKEPDRRYPTAQMFAEEIDRCLIGEPTLARPLGPVERGLRRLRKNKALAAGLGAVLLALVGGGGFAANEFAARKRSMLEAEEARKAAAENSARLEEERLKVEEKRQQLIEQLRNVARLALMGTLQLRRHGVPGAEETFLPSLQEAFRFATQQAPDLAEPYYHMGRMRRALLQWDTAAGLIDEALERAPRDVPSRYERIVLRARACALRLVERRAEWHRRKGAEAAAGGGVEAARVNVGDLSRVPTADDFAGADGRMKELLDGLRRDLTLLEEAAAGAPDHAARLDCARALVATFAADAEPKQVREGLTRALAADGRLEEAYDALARLESASGDFDAVIEILGRAIEADKGYFPHRLHRAAALRDRANGRYHLGEDPRPDYLAAESDYDAVLALAPANPEPWIGRGTVRWQIGSREDEVGEDPLPRYAGAGADLDEAVRLDPASVDAWFQRGQMRFRVAMHRSSRGEDPEPDFAAAEADLTRAVELDPLHADAWLERGVNGMHRATHATATDRDPWPILARAEEDMGKALALNPGFEYSWCSRGNLRFTWAWAARDAGRDPAEKLAQAEADYHKAIELGGVLTESWYGRGDVRKFRGDLEAAAGRDPGEWYKGAEADYTHALASDPGTGYTWRSRAELRLSAGDYQVAQGKDGKSAYASALEDCDRAVAINAVDTYSLCTRARVHFALERWAECVADFEASIRINPHYAESFRATWDEARRRLAESGAPK